MNWTGGRLQRHSKATNSNALAKAQKDHFARARLRLNTQPTAPTPLHIFDEAAVEEQRSLIHSRNRRNLDAPIDDRNSPTHRRPRPQQAVARSVVTFNQVPTRDRPTNIRNPYPITSPRVNSLEHVKHKLLNQTDWLRLGPTKPATADYKPTSHQEQVGRRRRVTREDRERQKYGRGNRKVEHNLIKPFARLQDAFAIRPEEAEDVSIRIGSNIHQSQTIKPPSCSVKLPSAVPESSSTDPMLLDIVETQLPLASKESGHYHLNDEDNEQYLAECEATTDENALIPLAKAREFASFDEVKAYSSSAKHSTSTSQPETNTKLQTPAEPQSGPQEPTSSSVVRALRPANRGIFSSDCNSHNAAILGSEPPYYSKHAEDTAMKDVEPLQESVEAEHASHRPDQKPSSDENHDCERITRSGECQAILPPLSSSRKVFRDRSASGTGSALYGRPAYTIERQVELAAKLQEQSLAPQAVAPPKHRLRPLPRSPRADKVMPHGLRSTTTRYPNREAIDKIDPMGHPPSFPVQMSPEATDQPRRQGDENEEWMRDVFVTDFDKLQERFSFAKGPVRRSTDRVPPTHALSSKPHLQRVERPDGSRWHEHSPQYSDIGQPKTIQTAANTTLNMRHETSPIHRENLFLPSDTDHLTQLSPMTGYLDERLANVSMYNNAARTVRSFVQAPSILAKRSASDAFGDDACDGFDRGSLSDGRTENLDSAHLHRMPLDTLYQVPLRNRIHGDMFSVGRRGEQPMSKPIWRLAEPPSPLKIPRGSRGFGSGSDDRHMQSPIRDTSELSWNHTPMRTYTGEKHAGRPFESVRQPLQTAASNRSSQYSSPTTPSQHRVPLSSGYRSENTATGIDERARPNDFLSANQMVTSPAPTGISGSSRYRDAAARSSSSRISNHRGARSALNFHTSDGQAFVFKRPPRPPAHYSHPLKAAPRFKIPAQVPLH